jgi:hypothetical protein
MGSEDVMRPTRASIVVIMLGVLFVCALTAVLAQDKYTLQIPEGLAFSEFKGYETWQVVSLSHSDDTLNVIVANPAMVQAYAAGIPGNGKPFPDGAKAAKIQYIPKKSKEAPFNVSIPDRLKDVAFMAKDSKRFTASGGWGYGMFNYDAKTDKFIPDGKGASCGFGCHTVVKSKDYVFTALEKR